MSENGVEAVLEALAKHGKWYRVQAEQALIEGARSGDARYERSGGEESAAVHLLAVALRVAAGQENTPIQDWMTEAYLRIEAAPHPNTWY